MVEEKSFYNEDDFGDDPSKLTENDIPKLLWMVEKRMQRSNMLYIDNMH